MNTAVADNAYICISGTLPRCNAVCTLLFFCGFRSGFVDHFVGISGRPSVCLFTEERANPRDIVLLKYQHTVNTKGRQHVVTIHILRVIVVLMFSCRRCSVPKPTFIIGGLTAEIKSKFKGRESQISQIHSRET